MQRFAPAKVNLFLHVGAPAADGYHPVCSLMAFADVGDNVRLVPDGEGLSVEGAFAAGLAGEGNNLVLRARDALLERAGRRVDFGLVLDKALPIAAGLGGGSSDAAAALRLIRDALDLAIDDAGLREIAGFLGADGPACLDAAPVVGTGRGDVLAPAPSFPSLPAVLANPGVASPTGPVYRAYDLAVAPEGANAPRWPEALETPAQVAVFLAACRNDLETPAVALAPEIGECLEILNAHPEPLLARMSGSGATCFALCADDAGAYALAERLQAEHPHWWVRACVIGGR
ncbi:MAG: 4-(cytidine 5'-diphospho)-2-C-methyl-D-erythritol kinase [Caulobacteraceae bacterium]|nr:4-(cytidine 5'-diphospho)-2-C-methyl-D-erythritol kinase [Caulobacteraceae bacterium]